MLVSLVTLSLTYAFFTGKRTAQPSVHLGTGDSSTLYIPPEMPRRIVRHERMSSQRQRLTTFAALIYPYVFIYQSAAVRNRRSQTSMGQYVLTV